MVIINHASSDVLLRYFIFHFPQILWNLLKICTTQRPGKKLAIFGNGATYHNSQEFREDLITINQDLSDFFDLLTI